MAFLDNSGDIILDAVLTDEGRRRLAQGNGTFNITKFALGDDEVDYSLYDSDHISGSAYYDLQILQTPVLEAFTDAGSSLKSPLITYLNNTKFYLPILRLNDKAALNKPAATTGSFMIAVTEATRDKFTKKQGILDGFDPSESTTIIRIDQGLHTEFEIPPDRGLDAEDRETQYTVLMDNRLGELRNKEGTRGRLEKSFVDDDNIATYYLTLKANPNVVTRNTKTEQAPDTQVIQGPRGTTVEFLVKSTLNLQKSNYLFDNIGTTTTAVNNNDVQTDIRVIDSIIKVMGTTTGYTIDIPVRYFKKSDE